MARRRLVSPLGWKLHRLEDRLAPAVVADVPTWSNTGPFGSAGTVSDIATHPTDPNIVFVSGATGGLWRTRNATSFSPTWQSLSDRLPSQSIASLDLNPANPNELTFSLGDKETGFRIGGDLVGVYSTSNALADAPLFTRLVGPKNEAAVDVSGGVVALNPQGAFVNNAVQSVVTRSLPYDATTAVAGTVVGYILAASDTGVYIAYRRLSGAIDEFARISGRNGLGADGYAASGGVDLSIPFVGATADIVADPSNPKRVYIADNRGLFRTDDITRFAPATAAAAATFPTFADLTPAVSAAAGLSTGSILAANASNNQKMRVAVHASKNAAGADVNVLYVAVVNPGTERSQGPPNDAGANPLTVDGSMSVFYSTDQLQVTFGGGSFATDAAGTILLPGGNPVPVPGFANATDANGNQIIVRGQGFGTGTFVQMDEPLLMTPVIGTIEDATYANPTSLKVVGHGLTTGDRVLIEQQGGNAAPNSVWTVTRTGKDTFTLDGSAGTGKFNLSNATIRVVHGIATSSDAGAINFASDNFLRLGITADPVDPNLVYIGGGDSHWRGTYVGDAYPTYFGTSVVRGDRSRPRLNGFISTELITNDITFQWTSLNGYKAASDSNPSDPLSLIPSGPFGRTVEMTTRIARNADGSVILNPDGKARVTLLAGTEFGLTERDNPRANGRLSTGSPLVSDQNVWTDRGGFGPTALSLGNSDGYFATESSTTDVNGVTVRQGRIDYPLSRQLFDPVTQASYSGDDVDGVTTPGVSYLAFGTFVQALGGLGGFSSFSLSTPTDAKFGSALIQADKNAGRLLTRLNQTRPTNAGQTSSGAQRVVIGGFAVYEDDEPQYFTGEPASSGTDDFKGIGNIVGNITPAGWAGGAHTSALTYGGRQPGAVITVDGRRRIEYVETPRVIYVGNDAGQFFVRDAAGGFRQITTLPGGGTVINDIVIDPDDWRIAYVLRNNSEIYRTTDAGRTWSPNLTKFYVDAGGNTVAFPSGAQLLNSGAFKTDGTYTGLGTYDNQGNVADGLTTQLFSLSLFDGLSATNATAFDNVQVGAVPGVFNGVDSRQDVLFVGGKGGVYRLVSLPDPTNPNGTRQAPVWNEFGVGLPNVPVTSVSLNTYTTAETKAGVTSTVRRVGMTIGTRGRGDFDISVPDARYDNTGPFNDVAPTASAATGVRIDANVQTSPTSSGAPIGPPLAGFIAADPNNTAFVIVSDGLGNTRVFERTTIQDFTFTGTTQPDRVQVLAFDPNQLKAAQDELATSAFFLAAAQVNLGVAPVRPVVTVTDTDLLARIGNQFDAGLLQPGLPLSPPPAPGTALFDLGIAQAELATAQAELAAAQAAVPQVPAAIAAAQAKVAAAQPKVTAAQARVDKLNADIAALRERVKQLNILIGTFSQSSLQYVRFPITVDLLGTAGDRVSAVNGVKAEATVATIDTVATTNAFGDVLQKQTVGGAVGDNLFNQAAGGRLVIGGLGLGTFDLNLGQRSALQADQPADIVVVAGTAAQNTDLLVGPRATVFVGTTEQRNAFGQVTRLAGSLDGLLGNVTVLANLATDAASAAAVVVDDRTGVANTAAIIGRETRSDGLEYGAVGGVGGPLNTTGVFYQNVASLFVNGNAFNRTGQPLLAEKYTISDPPAVLVLDAGGGPNEVNIQASRAKVVAITGSGDDLFQLSSLAGVSGTNGGDLSRIQGVVTIEAGGGNNRLVLNNTGSALASDVSILAAKITGATPNAISYAATGGVFRDTLDRTGRPGILYLGSDQAADTVRVIAVPDDTQVTVNGQGGPDTLTVVGDGLRSVALGTPSDVRLIGGGGGDTLTVTQGLGGVTGNSVQLVGSGTDTVVLEGFDRSSRPDVATIRVTGAGVGTAFVEGTSVAADFTGAARVRFDGLGGRNSLSVFDSAGVNRGSASDLANAIVFAPTGADAGEVRLGSSLPVVEARNVNGADDTGLVVYGYPAGGPATSDTLVVVAPSETGLTGAAPLNGLEAASAANTINVSDRQVTFERSDAGPLRSVALGRTTAGTNTFANLVVLAGSQTRQGDTVTVTPSRELNILVDGQTPATSGPTGNKLVIGTDQTYTLNVTNNAALGGSQTRVNVGNGTSFGYRNFGRLTAAAGTGRSVYAVGADVGGGPRVRVYDSVSRAVLFDQFVFAESFTGGVRVATGDVTADGIPDLIVAAGPGGGPRVDVYDGVSFKQVGSFYAYEKTFTGGLYLAVGDLDGDGRAEIVTGTGVGGGPLVKSFDPTGRQLNAVFAFESTFRGGVRVAVADTTGDGKAEIITTAGPGGGPVVRVFDATSLKPILEYFAADASLRTGLSVAAGDLTGDGVAEIIVAPASGPVSDATVRRGDGTTVSVPLFTDQGADPTPAPSAGTPLSDIGGVRLATADSDGTGALKVILAARGPGFPSKVYRYFIDPYLEADSVQAFEDEFVGGVWVG